LVFYYTKGKREREINNEESGEGVVVVVVERGGGGGGWVGGFRIFLYSNPSERERE
jgi:hypothetical protein